MCNYKAWCKATNKEGTEPEHSHNWVSSRRAWFRIYDDRVESGDWRIPKDSIKKAIVYKTKQMFIPVTILLLVTEDGSYQFGFNPWAKPVRHLKIDVVEQPIKLKYSAFSPIVRIIILVCILYWLWSEFA